MYAKFRKTLINVEMSFFHVYLSASLSVCPSDRPHGTPRLPLNGFSLNMMRKYFSKICRENSKFIKI